MAGRLTFLCMVTGLLVGAGGCRKGTAGGVLPRPPVQVAVVVAEAKTIPITYRFIGMTEPSKTVEIRSRITGFLLTRTFEEGKAIKAGDPLFTIDPRPFEADLEIARARQAQTEARLQLAETDLKRYTEAAASGAVARAELDKAQTGAAEARAALNLARAEVAKAELDLSYTKIFSPVTGVIGRALKDEGSYLDAGSNSLLAVATQTDPMYVVFPVPERDWLRWREESQSGVIKPGFTSEDGGPVDLKNPRPPVRVDLLDGTHYPVEGRLNFLDVRVDANTGTAVARASFKNPEGQLKAGQFVNAMIVGWERPDSVVVPQRAVVNSPAGSFVYLVDAEKTVRMQRVVLSDWKGDGWLVLSGVKSGDTVIADGFAKVPPGTKVETVPFLPLSEAGASGSGAAPAASR